MNILDNILDKEQQKKEQKEKFEKACELRPGQCPAAMCNGGFGCTHIRPQHTCGLARNEENYHSTCSTCNKMIPNQHFDCEREMKEHEYKDGYNQCLKDQKLTGVEHMNLYL